jgi:pimeloyl-ACP methyl ester carboxylesterase
MGRIVDMPLPRLGETMEEGRIVAWLKRPGEAFKRGETILEVETDKTVVEVPALQNGILREQIAKIEDRIAIDGIIARIEVEGDAANAGNPPPPVGGGELLRAGGGVPAVKTPSASRRLGTSPAKGEESLRVAASTAARRFARNNNLPLAGIAGTGRRGRISLADLKPADVPDHLALPQGRIALRSWKPAGPAIGTAFLIHGLFADAESWSVFARVLARKGYLVVALDLPAHGATEAAFETLDDVVAIAHAAIVETVRTKVTLVSHSFGGLVASALAPRLGAKLEELLLIAPAGFGPMAAGAFISSMLSVETAADAGRVLAALGAGEPTEAVRKALAAHIGKNRDSLARIAILESASVASDIAGLSAPATAVFSRDDQIIPVSQALNAPRNMAVRFTEGAGHVPHWFQADFLAGLLRSEKPAR